MSKRYYTTTQLGPKRSRTPEGYLLCEEVPLARTGEMIYGPREVPITPGPDGTITIVREEKDVFNPTFILSLAGKPVCNDHPPRDVNPDNWVQYARGIGQNPRRGTGELSDYIVGDLLIMEARAIQEVLDGKVEISLGYDAEYEELAPGRGRQYDMLANHIALVDNGRCGPVCAIRDSKGDAMKTRTIDDAANLKPSQKVKVWWDGISKSLREALKTKDEATLARILDEAAMPEGLEAKDDDPDADTHIHMHTGGASSKFSDEDHEAYRMQNDADHTEFRDDIAALKAHTGMEDAAGEEAIEGQLEEEAPAGTGDKARKAKDSAFLDVSFQEAISGAEILAPGIGVPTFDGKASPKKTLDAICGLRRKSLELAYATPEGRTIIESANGGRPLVMDSLSCTSERALFRAAVAIRKAKNNLQTDKGRHQSNRDTAKGGLTRMPADINEANKKFYGA